MKIKPQAAFKALADGRKARAAAAASFSVHAVTKSGAPFKTAMAFADTREAAEAKAAYFRSVNPGKDFVVIAK